MTRDIDFTIRIDLPDGTRIGPGKVLLLETIGETGSISAAARTTGISYRKTWLLIEELNKSLKQPVVRTKSGGATRGGAEVTKYDREIIAIYRSIESRSQREAASGLRKLRKMFRSRAN
jgi:molybdate transport system regulatory protein